MKNLLFIVLVALIVSCNDKTVEPEKEKPGSVTITLDKTNIPDNIVVIKATVSRTGFDDIVEELDLLSSVTAEINIGELVAGEWHLAIEAFDSNEKAIYAGEKDIEIKPGEVLPLSIKLDPVTENLGGLYIYVNWDNLPYNWFDQPVNPLIRKGNTQYDNLGVSQPIVLEEDGTYQMWYSGLSDSNKSYIFYATSTDGLRWTKYELTPVLYPGSSGSWDDLHVSNGLIIKENDEYKMYYVGYHDYTQTWKVGLAISTDGINWTKDQQPVLEGGTWDKFIQPTSIIKIGSTYRMYYSGSDELESNWKIGLATSTDGVSWEKFSGNPIMETTLQWEQPYLKYPSIIYENDMFKMIYQGGGTNTNAFGIAYSQDGINWEKNDEPFFQSSMSASSPNKIAYPQLIKLEDEYRIYYSGFDQNDIPFINVARKFMN